MIKIQKAIEEAILAIDRTADLFYQDKENLGYKDMENTLFVIGNAIESINEYYSQQEQGPIIMKEVNEILMKAMKAMEDKDSLLLSDVLQYELKEFFQQMIEQ